MRNIFLCGLMYNRDAADEALISQQANRLTRYCAKWKQKAKPGAFNAYKAIEKWIKDGKPKGAGIIEGFEDFFASKENQ